MLDQMIDGALMAAALGGMFAGAASVYVFGWLLTLAYPLLVMAMR